MTLIEYYLTYLQQLADAARTPPQGITLPQAPPAQRAAVLQTQIQTLGVPEFVRLCAAQDGQELPPEVYSAYREEDLYAALRTLAEEPPSAAEPAACDDSAPPKIDEPDGPRSAYEVLLDCCCLDEQLLYYLIDILRREAEEEFQKLALVTTRTAFTSFDFLSWFSGKHLRAEKDEMICVTLMDACLDRLAQEGQKELIAALLCGDRTTFELFRCDAPELMHLPEATFEWYERHYLNGYYPIRYMLKYNRVIFPDAS